MFEEFTAGDKVLDQEAFLIDEVQYNLIHLIGGFVDSIKIKSAQGNLIFAQSAGHNAWLWISREIESAQRKLLVQELVEYVKHLDYSFPGVSADPDLARLFAESFCESNGGIFHTNMTLEAYQCPVVKKPTNVDGSIRLATEEYTTTIAEFLAYFLEDAFGETVQAESMLALAKKEVDSGNLYLWIVDETPVSMAKLAHRTLRHVRLNEVYTSRDHRKQGYASALVAELCEQMHHEGLRPLLYADAKNPDSNNVYQAIGFVKAGAIAELKFDL